MKLCLPPRRKGGGRVLQKNPRRLARPSAGHTALTSGAAGSGLKTSTPPLDGLCKIPARKSEIIAIGQHR